ncbi:hypothetical protein ABZY05_27100 [Streptomyces canus]|uniref:hypothetical protein n=1 Tax=Streptomyces canus TaxID=58343 RepID=UPI0033A0A8E6
MLSGEIETDRMPNAATVAAPARLLTSTDSDPGGRGKVTGVRFVVVADRPSEPCHGQRERLAATGAPMNGHG